MSCSLCSGGDTWRHDAGKIPNARSSVEVMRRWSLGSDGSVVDEQHSEMPMHGCQTQVHHRHRYRSLQETHRQVLENVNETKSTRRVRRKALRVGSSRRCKKVLTARASHQSRRVSSNRKSIPCMSYVAQHEDPVRIAESIRSILGSLVSTKLSQCKIAGKEPENEIEIRSSARAQNLSSSFVSCAWSIRNPLHRG